MSQEMHVLRLFDDLHVHFRIGELLEQVLPITAVYCGRAIAMPNLRPRPVLTGNDVIWYRDEILRVRDKYTPNVEFTPLMTIEIRDDTTPEMIYAARKAGAVAGKVYPRGVTTNSDSGLSDFISPKITDTFRAMQECGMLLLLHGEIDREGLLVTRREHAFMPILIKLATAFPDLKIVLEHITTRNAVEVVKKLGKNVAATITAHHLLLTLNNVIGSGIEVNNGCMPMPKGFGDLAALIKAATSGNEKFFLGSDSAPHPKANKECAKAACGVFSAPILPQLLVELFIKWGKIHLLQAFTSEFGAKFYGLPLNKGTITVVRKDNIVPAQIGDVVPFLAGKTLQYQLSN